MAITTDDLAGLFTAFRNRWAERDARMLTTSMVVSGEGLITTTPDDDDQVNNSPNLIQVGIEDTAESAALMPTVRARPVGSKKEQKLQAAKMERIAAGYLDRAGGSLFLTETLYDLVGFGLIAATVLEDKEARLPRIDHRQAVNVYPEPGWRPGDSVRRCIMARSVYATQLPAEYQTKLQFDDEYRRAMDTLAWNQQQIILLEWFDEEQVIVAALYSRTNMSPLLGRSEYAAVELDRWDHGYGLCPVVVDQRITLDGEPRGQFDQVIEPMLAHARLMGMAIDYADQAVYSDIWVKDPMGPIPYGGGSIIQLGLNGAIGRVPPAVSSLSLFQELEQLMDAIHLGGRWPKSRPGEIDQSIASAKFLETSVGVMNTAIKTYHQILMRFLERLLRIAFVVDCKMGGRSVTTSGVLRNQEFVEEYDPSSDIDLKCRVSIEYGLGLGRDASQSAVLHIQYHQGGFISREFVQESIEGVTDVERERRRIDVEKLHDMMFAKLMQSLEAGAIPDKALVDITKARENGDDIVDVFKKYVVDPAEAAMQTGIQSGLGAGLLQPGPAPAAPGGPAPSVPSAPSAPEMLAQLSTPAGNPGSFLGTRVQGGE